MGPYEQKELMSAGQWLFRGEPQTWCFTMFFISTSEPYKVEPPDATHTSVLPQLAISLASMRHLTILGPWWGHLHSHSGDLG